MGVAGIMRWFRTALPWRRAMRLRKYGWLIAVPLVLASGVRADEERAVAALQKAGAQRRGPASPDRPHAARLPGGLPLFLRSRQVLEVDVLEGDFHAGAVVQLPGDDALVGYPGELLVHGRHAVDLDRHLLADA